MHQTPPRQWGLNVRDARRTFGLTGQSLAYIVGVHESTVSRIENGQIGISDRLKVALATALETDPAQLFPLSELAA